MKASIQDVDALRAISPAALSAYARAAGWSKAEVYGEHSDVYASESAPEIVVPRTQRLGDYASVVARLVEIFAETAGTNTLSLYRDLVTADRDVLRVRALPGNGNGDGSVTLDDGANLITGARDMLLAAACSLREPKRLYRPGANQEVKAYLQRVHLGQSEQGSFVVTLLTPVVPPSMQQTSQVESFLNDQPIERRVTQRLIEALMATHKAVEEADGGDTNAFSKAVKHGVSANLCEALATSIEPFHGIDVALTWARTRPVKGERRRVCFGAPDASILREAAQRFRAPAPRPDIPLVGHVRRLKRDEEEAGGAVTLQTCIDGRVLSVAAVLSQTDYDRTIQAHRDNDPVVMRGDLERFGRRWRMRNPRIVDVLTDEEGER